MGLLAIKGMPKVFHCYCDNRKGIILPGRRIMLDRTPLSLAIMSDIKAGISKLATESEKEVTGSVVKHLTIPQKMFMLIFEHIVIEHCRGLQP